MRLAPGSLPLPWQAAGRATMRAAEAQDKAHAAALAAASEARYMQRVAAAEAKAAPAAYFGRKKVEWMH